MTNTQISEINTYLKAKIKGTIRLEYSLKTDTISVSITDKFLPIFNMNLNKIDYLIYGMGYDSYLIAYKILTEYKNYILAHFTYPEI